MGKRLRFLLVSAMISLFSTNAVAQDDGAAKDGDKAKKRVSANGSYEFKPSWGIGLQYGMTFTEMENWNDYLLKPGGLNWFDVNFVAEHELYVEATPVEGFRISAFGGFQSVYTSKTGFSYGYAGLEPAFSVRRSFYEFAVGIGLAYGKDWLDAKGQWFDDDIEGHGLLVRPFVEARFYPCDIFAIYLRVAFGYFKDFGIDIKDKASIQAGSAQGKAAGYGEIKEDKLSYAGPNVAIGFRFGVYDDPIKKVGDRDGDGVLDDIDDCPDDAGDASYNGCMNPDTDGDGLCDPWVGDRGLMEAFSCKAIDKCIDDAEDMDGFEDEDGCPDVDNDNDGVCDSWVADKGLSEKYASICKGADKCDDEQEDIDGNLDSDGCADPDNDGDGLCDPWVSEKGLSSKYASVCKGIDYCPDYNASADYKGCPNPDSDDDGYCDAWVYENHLEAQFPKCKGLDVCPGEKGEDTKGCIKRRVEVTSDKIQINEAINFATNKATIQKSSDSLLEEIAQVFKDNPRIKLVEIQGHTDLSGNAKKNQKLSEDRAKSVYDRLVKLGVEKERMQYKGFGMSQPVEPLAKGQKKETKEQAAKNRRVVFEILKQDEVKTTMTLGEAINSGAAANGNQVTVLSRSESAAIADAEAKAKEAEAAKAKADAAATARAKAEAEAAAKAAEAAKKVEADAKKKADAEAKKAADAAKKAEAEAKKRADAEAKAAKKAEDAAKKAEADAKKKAEAEAKKAADAAKKAEADAKKKAEAEAKKAADAAKKAEADAKKKAEADAKKAADAAKKASDDDAKKKAEAEAKAKAAAAAAKAKADAAKAKAAAEAAKAKAAAAAGK